MSTTKSYDAMVWAMELHRDQVRKYTGNPYIEHLAEVAGIAATALKGAPACALAVAWLHDSMEDCGVSKSQIARYCGADTADGVEWLSDLESGNRAERKAASRARLSAAPWWVQTIKCADLISNTKSIVQFDPKFAVTYLEEKRALLEVLTQANPHLRKLAMQHAGAAQ